MKQKLYCPKVNFTFSQAAFDAIKSIRNDWIRKFPGENPDIISVAWGLYYFNDGRRDECVIVSFYTQDMRAEMVPHIQYVQEREVIFFTLDKYAIYFKGKVIDFSEENFFFLRDP